jgi:transcriptional regulator with XRE-family HTH domain
MTAELKALGRHLGTLRAQAGHQPCDVASHMGVMPQYVKQIETSGRDLKYSTILRYCAAIGATIRIELEEAP